MDNVYDDENNIIVMYDDNEEEIEFNVMNTIEYDGKNYLLVIEAGLDDEQHELDATILKKVSENGNDFFYSQIHDDNEFNKIAKLFAQENDDFEIK